uniref:Uncharacterized protein n=1 Tax=Heterorhabditis bacteriophora TaxID=37862 RepID=A0A1I7WXE5_HETBA
MFANLKMDSRVAGMIADTLFEVQAAMNKELPELFKTDESTFNDVALCFCYCSSASVNFNDLIMSWGNFVLYFKIRK